MQHVKHNDGYSDWSLVLESIPQGVPWFPFAFSIMLMRCQHGCLLQFVDDTCLIFAGDSHGVMAGITYVLSTWVSLSKMKLNLASLM